MEKTEYSVHVGFADIRTLSKYNKTFDSYRDALLYAKEIRDNLGYTTTILKKEVTIVNKIGKTT